MISIPIHKWEEFPNGIRKEVSTLNVITILLNNCKPESLPRGIDAYRTFGRIAQAFDNAEASGVLELDDKDYVFLLGIVEKDIPSNWAFNKEISKAISLFINKG